MIKLQIEDYCENCTMMDPETEPVYADNLTFHLAIVCRNRFMCANVYAHAKKEREKDD